MSEQPDPPEGAPRGAPSASSSGPPTLGVVAIGRNEGERLVRCLQSALDQEAVDGPVVYVDSGSTDGSRERARELGVEVVELDLSRPFTAARARNEGFAHLVELAPTLQYVQFVDGDCEFERDWLARAREALDERPELAVVCGRRRERFPELTVYNRLCDMEWDTPVGDAEACGGDAMFRVVPFRAVDGYDSRLIAGEEPELCFRLREAGHKVRRMDAPMTIHDADMNEFSQFWLRSKRNGHAVAEAVAMHGEPRHRRAMKSALVWGGFGMPATAVCVLLTAIAWFAPEVDLVWVGPIGLLAATFGYLRLFGRIYQHRIRHGDPADHARLYARFTIIGKLSESAGIALYLWNRHKGRAATLIEYKGAATAATDAVQEELEPPRRHSA